MDSPENSQREQNKRRPTISKGARPPLAEKSNNIQNRSASGKIPGSQDPVPNTSTPAKNLAQEISDQLLRENNSHVNNETTTKPADQ